MKRVLVSGSLSFDRIMDFPGLFRDHFLPENLHAINVSFAVGSPKVERGGCAGNIAYSLSLLETPSDILGCAGSDFASYEEHLTARGIGTEHIDRYDEPGSSAYIMTDTENNQITAFSEGAGGKACRATPDLSTYELLIVGPGAAANMEAAARQAKEAGLPYFFDPGQQIPALSAEALRSCIEGSVALFVNDYELALIIEKTGMREEELRKDRLLIVTYGKEGSRIGDTHVKALEAKQLVDPTGAGDAYRAGFIAAYVRGLPPETCAKVGSAVAVHAVECYGTQNHTFSMDGLRSRYEDAYQDSFPF